MPLYTADPVHSETAMIPFFPAFPKRIRMDGARLISAEERTLGFAATATMLDYDAHGKLRGCFDIPLFIRHEDGRLSFCAFKRKTKPLAEFWWFPGGTPRVHQNLFKGQTDAYFASGVLDLLAREIGAEATLLVESIDYIGTSTYTSYTEDTVTLVTGDKVTLPEHQTTTVNMLFAVVIPESAIPMLDEENHHAAGYMLATSEEIQSCPFLEVVKEIALHGFRCLVQ